MRLIRQPALLALLILLCHISAGHCIWHCGDITLEATPGGFLIDPVTGDLFIDTDTALIIRIDEATCGTGGIDVLSPVSALALNPATGLLYAAHADAGMVTVLSIATSDTTLIRVGSDPSAFAADALRNRVFVGNSGDSTISVVTGTSLSDTIRCSGTPTALAVDPSTGRGFALLTDSNLLFSFYMAGGDTAYFSTGPAPAEIEIDPEKGVLYIADSGASAITVFVIESDSSFSIPVGGPPTALALNPETARLFVAGSSGNITVVNTDTYATQNILLPGIPRSLAVDPLSDRAFASLPASGLLVEISSAGDTSLVSLPGSPGSISVNPITNRCYVSNPGVQGISVLEAADYTAERIDIVGGPGEVVINMESHQVYTPNWFSARVAVIDGYTNAKSSFRVADGPNGVEIDPVTDDVYVVCAWGGMVTVKRSGQPDTLLVPIGGYAHGMDLNPNTGKAYVSNRFTCDLSVIDMQTLDTTLVRMGGYPCFVSVNLDHNMIYVPNRTSWTLSVVQGATLATTFARIGHKPTSARVNPVTNTIYTVEPNSRSISAVDGATLERTKIPVGTSPSSLSINPNTNTVYVTSRQDGEVTVVDGVTHRRRPVRCEYGLGQIKADPWLDRAFTVSWDWENVTLIDGNFLSTLRIPVGLEPHGTAYDPVLEKLYVSNHAGNSMDVFKLREKIAPRIEVAVDTLADDVAYTLTPTLTGTATSLRTPRNYGIMKVLYKIDNLRGPWHEATITGSGPSVTWNLTTPPLLLGTHLLFVAAIDSSACTLASSSSSSLLRVSDICCYEFTCLTPPPEAPKSMAGPGTAAMHVSAAWTHTCGEGGWYEIEISGDPTFATVDRTIPDVRQPTYVFATDGYASSPCYWRVAALDYPHGKRSEFSQVYSIGPREPEGEIGPTLQPTMLTAYPNPSPGGVVLNLSGIDGTEARCSIYDVSGRLIRILPLTPSKAGLSGRWDATDLRGHMLPPGIYYASVRTAQTNLRRKLVLIR